TAWPRGRTCTAAGLEAWHNLLTSPTHVARRVKNHFRQFPNRMHRMKTHSKVLLSVAATAAALVVSIGFARAEAHKAPKAPKSVRLYIFDCGVIHTTNGDSYSLKKEEMASTEMSIPCILVAHPKGTLMWDNGDIPDRAFPAGGGRATAGVVTQDTPLLPQ